MDTKTKNSNTILKLKNILSNSKARYILGPLCVSSVLVIVIFSNCPLKTKLDNASSRLQEMEAELSEKRSSLAMIENPGALQDKVIKQKDIPLVIDELTKQGENLGLQFISVSQSELQPTQESGIMRLPVNLRVESGYKNIGKFLCYIEDDFKRVVKTENLAISSKLNESSRLSAELSINLYVGIN